MRLPNFLHALSVIAGFAAGGALVTLVIAMQRAPWTPTIVLEDVQNDESSPIPATFEDRDEEGLPAPANEPVRRLTDPSPTVTGRGDLTDRVGGSIDADSLAALIEALRDRDLELPVADIDRDAIRDDYHDPRGEGRTHEALDLLAPRGTPVVAVEDGTIASLDPSQGGGGIVVYQFDPSGEFVYYYAHLEGYASALEEGDRVERGDVIGYVGTSGNAPPNVPHLHFAIHKTAVGYRWWKGIPINPFLILR